MKYYFHLARFGDSWVIFLRIPLEMGMFVFVGVSVPLADPGNYDASGGIWKKSCGMAGMLMNNLSR